MKDSEVVIWAGTIDPYEVMQCRKCGALVAHEKAQRHVRWHRALEILLNLRSDEDEEADG